MAIDPRFNTPLINTGIGAGALLLGALVMVTARSDEAAALRALPVVDARGLAQQAAGTAVLVEGRVGQHAVIEAGLVALQRQQAGGVTKPGTNEVRFAWEPRSVALPTPFTLDTASGVVTLRNTDFAWRDAPRTAAQPSLVTAGSTRVVGFAAGDVITVRATVVDGKQATLHAVEVFGGTHAAYLHSAAASDAVTWVLGGGFALVGVGMLIAGGIGLLRARRTPAVR